MSFFKRTGRNLLLGVLLLALGNTGTAGAHTAHVAIVGSLASLETRETIEMAWDFGTGVGVFMLGRENATVECAVFVPSSTGHDIYIRIFDNHKVSYLFFSDYLGTAASGHLYLSPGPYWCGVPSPGGSGGFLYYGTVKILGV